MIHDVKQFGATGDGQTKDTLAIQSAIDKCSTTGGGSVVLSPGTYLCGTLELKDNTDLHLMQGATLLGSPRQEDYTKRYNAPYDNGFASEGTFGHHLITAWRKNNIMISGTGVIDGNAQALFGPPVASPIKESVWNRIGRWRPGQMVGLVECTAVRIENITLRNSPYWTIWPYACREVVITGVKIRNDAKSPNGDGIDPDCCENVIIANCDIASGDDAIALRADRYGKERFRKHIDLRLSRGTAAARGRAMQSDRGKKCISSPQCRKRFPERYRNRPTWLRCRRERHGTAMRKCSAPVARQYSHYSARWRTRDCNRT